MGQTFAVSVSATERPVLLAVCVLPEVSKVRSSRILSIIPSGLQHSG